MSVTAYTFISDTNVLDNEPGSQPGSLLLTFATTSGENWPVGTQITLTYTGSSGSVLVDHISTSPSTNTTLFDASFLTLFSPDYFTLSVTNNSGLIDPSPRYVYVIDSGGDTILNYAIFCDLPAPIVQTDPGSTIGVLLPARLVEVPIGGPVREIGVSIVPLNPVTFTGVTATPTGVGLEVIIESGLNGSGDWVYPSVLRILLRVHGGGQTPDDVEELFTGLFATSGTQEPDGNWLQIDTFVQYLSPDRVSRRRSFVD